MSKKTDLKRFVGTKIDYLQSEAAFSTSRAMLAKLRQGIGYEPGELPQLFGMILLDMPESFYSENGIATKEEWACYVAFTLYALHQQGYDIVKQQMHTKEDISIGIAISKFAHLCDDLNAEERMLQRLKKLTSSSDMKELAYHLRGIVQLLKSKGIPINYEMLAVDLYEIQFSDEKVHVCLRWGQDFYRRRNK